MSAVLIELDSAAMDGKRLERSLGLVGEKVGDGRYKVAGGREPHWVDLYTANHPRCDCADHLWREALCKHILAALLREGHEQVIRAVGGLVASLRVQKAA
ncbi:MAG TPA: SWIM zinc finger family protein [Gemmatimonadaceae bacterium]|nr:SWIM zinc finger family protein [Gemmatimonadaceae bacterium]